MIPMITVTMDQMLDFRNNADFFDAQVVPLKGAYKLNKIKKAIAKETEFYGEKFQEIVDKYAQKNENGEVVFSDDGGQILIQDGMVEECNKALDDLQNLEVEIDNCNLKLEDLGDIQCTPEQLEAIMPFME